MKRYLRPVAFSLMGTIILLLIAASVLEKIYGTPFAVQYFYTAPWTIALWAGAVVTGLGYMFTVKMYRQAITCLLHFSFVVILGGAMVTHLFGKNGEVHLRLDDEPQQVLDSSLDASLQDFRLTYYAGTRAPMDYVSDIRIRDGKDSIDGQVSMNHILSYRHYRFYQSRYDTDGRGTTLSVSYDPWGIGITYCGYALLLISMILFFFQKGSRFRQLLRSPLLKVMVVAAGLLSASGAQASDAKSSDEMPPTLQRPVAKTFGSLYVYYNNRICPVTTLANDFCTKLYGKPSYKGLTAEQVLTGWLFYYDQWATCPMIKIKGDDIRRTLGITGKYACLNDFAGHGQYKLDSLLAAGNRNAQAANEKFRLVSMVSTGSLLRIWCVPAPASDDAASIDWLSLTQQPPTYLPKEDRQFIIGGMNYVAMCLMEGRNKEANKTLQEIRDWQRRHLTYEGKPAIADSRFRAEQVYNSFRYTRPLAMACATVGLALFIVCIMLIAGGKTLNSYVYYGLTGLMAALWLLLTFALGLRWVVSGHIPLSNGFETMQFLAWVTALVTVILCLIRRNSLILPFGYLICGMTMMVSMMSSSNPQITLLMPVLQSPLLTLHVAVIMIAYCLLAFTMLNGVTGLILHVHNKRTGNQNDQTVERLQVLSQLLLYPAVFCLTIGIFIGAVWANISWGRYWGWDPKEVWALITMLIYAAPLHTGSLPFLARPRNFHLYMVLAFLAVLFTYFGVNFILGGMHSYA